MDKAIERKTGARGLRSIIEDMMRDIMFEIPSIKNVEKCIITKDVVLQKAEPKLIIGENKEQIKKEKRQIAGSQQKETA